MDQLIYVTRVLVISLSVLSAFSICCVAIWAANRSADRKAEAERFRLRCEESNELERLEWQQLLSTKDLRIAEMQIEIEQLKRVKERTELLLKTSESERLGKLV